MRLILSLAVLLAATGCASLPGLSGGPAIHGNGQRAQDVRAVASLSALKVNNLGVALQVDVQVGPQPSLRVEADGNLLALIHTEARGDTLHVWTDRPIQGGGTIHLSYTTPQLHNIVAAGAGQINVAGLDGGALEVVNWGTLGVKLAGKVNWLGVRVDGSGRVDATQLTSGTTTIGMNGAGDVDLGQVRGSKLSMSMNGAGKMRARGAVDVLEARANGAGAIDTAALQCTTAELSADGGSHISATVSQAVVARANGASGVTVRGNPAMRTLSGTHIQFVD
ncbi:GIN domain-containing protein [Janthinobacterium fluminis]|uniref:DUF2807 domain-containing protein n=1 Tax=Janthinobacterium fluminis TaxID=2987524 RepID=A0ABT5JYQ9_9BURK|nr:DUF2807 domain-containing protein [Janthinobacterium fluminis]MDC8757867.1 DUF2807 domain-containing protein [Janthinobacterium fluminis]